MKLFNFLTRIFCASFLVMASPCVFAGWISGAEIQKILDQNPQLKSAGILPTNLDPRSGDQCGQFSEGKHDHHSEALSASLKGITRNHTCLYIDADKGFKSYEKGYGEKRHFVIVLHLDTPKVWRVYEMKRSGRPGKSYEVSLLAEFDIHSKRVAATTVQEPK